MNKYCLGLCCGAALLVCAELHAADVKSYQVTGPVLDVTPTSIIIQKGNDKWELARDSNTKVTGELKTGAKVTIHYIMVATDVEVKSGKGTTKDSKTSRQ